MVNDNGKSKRKTSYFNAYSTDDIDHWSNLIVLSIDFTVLLGNQAPNFVQVDCGTPLSVLQDTISSHTDLTEVAWMTKMFD